MPNFAVRLSASLAGVAIVTVVGARVLPGVNATTIGFAYLLLVLVIASTWGFIEAAVASGSLITARSAADQGRDVFAIPGSIHSPLSKGCHALIKSGAKLVESADDVLSELAGFRPSGYASTAQPAAAAPSSGLLAVMGHDPVDVDSLCARAGLSADQVTSELLRLELDGRVAALPGGLYQRLEKAHRG
jgi:DNA processing protein